VGAGKPGAMKPNLSPSQTKPGSTFGLQPSQADKPAIKLAGGAKPVK